jgi:WhiB family redox-sensing transcriptional regulator
MSTATRRATGVNAGDPTRMTLADILGIHIPDWFAEGLCAQTDPEAFYPEKGGSTREAKRVCLGCPVRNDCLQWALDRQERFGIWGGLSERERRQVARNQGRAAG